MDCGTSMVKYILFIFNSIVTIVGILGIVYGVLILKSLGVLDIHGSGYIPPQAQLPLVLIVLGSVIVFISFLGCCGAIRESVCMTMCYAVLMLVLLIVQLTLVVLLFTHKDAYLQTMSQLINEAWDYRSTDTSVFEGIQQTLKCCGVYSFVDYLGTLPASCCNGSCFNPLNYYPGCKSKFNAVITGQTDTAKYAGLGLIGVEFVGFIFACCLANNIRNIKRRHAY